MRFDFVKIGNPSHGFPLFGESVHAECIVQPDFEGQVIINEVYQGSDQPGDLLSKAQRQAIAKMVPQHTARPSNALRDLFK